MTNISAYLAKSAEEQAFYNSRGSKGSYTQRKNRALIRRIQAKEPNLVQTLDNLVVAASRRLTREDWLIVWREAGWDGSHPYPYPAFVHVPAPPPPALAPFAAYNQHAHDQQLRDIFGQNPPNPPPPVPQQRPNPPPPAPRAQPSPPQPQAGPSRPSGVAYQAPHPYGRPQEPVAGPSRLGGHAQPAPAAGPSRLGGQAHLAAAAIASSSPLYNPRAPPSSFSSPKPLHATQSQRDFRFKSKLDRFYAQPALQRDEEGRCNLTVSRDELLQSGYNEVMAKTPAMLKKLLVVKFHGEDGDDAGGLSKEFFFLLSQELFNPEYGLFQRGTKASNYNTQINPDSGMIDPEHHLQHFRLFGRCVALSIFHHRLIDVQFAPTFYQAMLGQNLTLMDLKAVDEPLWKSLTWTLNNNIEGVLDDETFSYVEESMFGEQLTIDIVPGGSKIALTNANKSRYVDAMVRHKTLGRTQEQFKSFMSGIDEIVHRDHLKVFSASELEALISGSSTLDVADWRKHTELENYTVNDPQIKWLWKVVENWDNAMRSRFLQFATGAARIPLTGFRDLRGGGESRLFKITRVGAPTALPAAHSCFNRVDLPPYSSMAILEQKLTMAILESGSFEQA